MEKDEKGITADKDEFSEWFTQLIIKSELADYSRVSGCIVLRPLAYSIWEFIMDLVNQRIKKLGVKNVYFPLFIPESLLTKEKDHIAGFSPEVAWVTQAGDSKLSERLAVRPTSEAIMYDSFSKWIRSWRDLPLKFNQWSNVVRWEFKHPVPFFRTREFIFNEGHTVYATQQEAEKEKDKILKMYKDICENYLALPSLVGKKTEREKFAGAIYTASMEFYMPNGKTVQGPDFHHDGQNFSKAYDIKFLNEDGKEQYAWQNTWAISTRMLGVMFAVHSDSKGLILPPKIAPNKVVIIPILFKESKEKVIKKAEEIMKKLSKYSAFVDAREEYSPGFKYNEWELKGVPIRIEIGPKDLEKNQAIIVRRDTNEKIPAKIIDLDKKISQILDDIQKRLFEKAKNLLYDNIVQSETLKELRQSIKNKKICLTPLCSSQECEEKLKQENEGAKVLNIPEKQPETLNKAKCVICNKKADYYAYVARSY
ncbi:MAG: proline--tRNA ligase [Nanoarchaeota archaeon]